MSKLNIILDARNLTDMVVSKSNAQTRTLKNIMHGSTNWNTMPDYMKESLHMIF